MGRAVVGTVTNAVGFADIVAGAIIGAMANTMGFTDIMVGAIVGAVTYAMRLADIVVGAIVSAMANAMQAAFIVITTIIAATPAVRASQATVAGMPTLAAVARAAVATVAAAVAAVASAMAATTATAMATTTSAATVTASTSTMPTAAAVTASSTAMATTAAMASSTTAMTSSATAMAATTATAIFRISAGEITDLVRYQSQRCRKSAANGERQQAFLEQHDESPLQGCSFTLETNATTNESRLPYGQPANQRVLHPGVCADVRMHVPSEASQPVLLRGIFSHVSSIDLWYRESMTSYPLAIWPKPQPVDGPFRGARPLLHKLHKVGERGFAPLERPNP